MTTADHLRVGIDSVHVHTRHHSVVPILLDGLQLDYSAADKLHE